MSEILICTMGLAPGVVTRITQYLQNNEDEQDETKRKKRDLAEVWVVFTANEIIMDLYNHILRKEFDRHLRLQGKHFPHMLSMGDLVTRLQIEQFFTELAALIKKKLDVGETIVHLCISGGRKSMTYAAAMAVQQVAAEKGEDVTSNRLRVWHIQLEEEEPRRQDVEWLMQNYQNDRISSTDRERILYPRDVIIVELSFFHFEQKQDVRQEQGRYKFTPRAR